MAKASRTPRQIENDVKRIQKAAQTARNIEELGKFTGLTYSMIKTSLLNHPIISNRIRDQLMANSKKFELEQRQKEIKEKSDYNDQKKSHSDVITNLPKFVIDSSIVEFENLEEYLLKLCSCKATVIVPAVVVSELKKMQYFESIDANNSKYILDLLASRPNNFKIIPIAETASIDESIISYCVNNNENLTLLTAKKELAEIAKMRSVHVHYVEPKSLTSSARIMTLYAARKVGNSLLVSNFQRNKSIRVFSDNIEYNDGIKELKIGDDVYISAKKDDYFTFAHYRIISLCAENNCELLFSKRFYSNQEIIVPNAAYKSFIKDFMYKLNL